MSRFKIFFSFFFITLGFFNLKLLIIDPKIIAKPFTLFQENDLLVDIFSTQTTDDDPFKEYDLLSNIDDFVTVPKGGTHWKVFGETGMKEYTFNDKDGNEWIGVRPEFSKEIKNLESKKILIQGFMFPLEQKEKQSLFLLGPFPVSCPYHPHTSANLIIEVHADKPIPFSYDAVNIEGILELVAKDDEYNVFFRLREAKINKNN